VGYLLEIFKDHAEMALVVEVTPEPHDVLLVGGIVLVDSF
jgi:hypothetical protein